MRFLSLLFILLSQSVFLHAQSTLKGIVVDTKEIPISYANVVLSLPEDSTYISGLITDENGTFLFDKLTDKEYNIEISLLGYTTLTKLIRPNNTGAAIKFTLAANATQLEEVIVKGKRKLIITKTDRIVVDIENSMKSNYGNAVDVLSVTPSLKVQNNQLQMLGKSAVVVLINNRPSNLSGESLMTFLETLSSQSIKSIEIMTTPPPEYESNGNGGIINILLKEEVSDSWKANIGVYFRKRAFYKASNNAALTYNKGKFFFSNSFYLQEGVYRQGQENTSFFEQDNWFTESSFDRRFLEYNNRMSIGYQLSPKYSIRFQYLYSGSNQSTTEMPYTIITAPSTDAEIGRLNSNGYIEQDRNIHSLNFNQSIDFDSTGKQLSINLDFFDFKDIEDKSYDGVSELMPANLQYYKGKNINSQKINNKSVSFDFKLPFSKFSSKFGGKLAKSAATNIIQLANTGLIDSIPTNLTPSINDFEYDESVSAIYASIDPTLPKDWSISLGLRFESVKIASISTALGVNNKKTLNSFLPVIFLSKKLQEKTTLGISYNRRISRPSFYLITPNPWITNPFNQVVGNPFLLPSFSDNLEGTLTFHDFYIKAYHTKIKNAFSQIPITNEQDKTVVFKFVNFPSKKNTGITLQHNWELMDRWTMNNTVDMNYGQYHYGAITLNGINTYFSTSHDLMLNKSKTLQMNVRFWLSPKGVDEIWNVRSQSSLSSSIQYNLLDGKLSFSVHANDILRNQIESLYATVEHIGQGVAVYYDSRYLGLSINYNFGNTTLKDKKTTTGNKEEVRRTGN